MAGTQYAVPDHLGRPFLSAVRLFVQRPADLDDRDVAVRPRGFSRLGARARTEPRRGELADAVPGLVAALFQALAHVSLRCSLPGDDARVGAVLHAGATWRS